MKEQQKGFTLVELLVVIAIIGIIGSIVLVYLGGARGRGNDTKVRAQLNSIRSAAELFFSTNDGYNGSAGNITGSCTTANSMFTDTVSGMVKFTTEDNYPSSSELTCYSTEAAYAVSATLPGAGGTNSWCVDSLGSSKARSAPINSTAC